MISPGVNDFGRFPKTSCVTLPLPRESPASVSWLVALHPSQAPKPARKIRRTAAFDDRGARQKPENYRRLPSSGKCRSWWVTDDAELFVDFDAAGTAIGVVVGDVTAAPPTFTKRIRRWLGL